MTNNYNYIRIVIINLGYAKNFLQETQIFISLINNNNNNNNKRILMSTKWIMI